jgi:hypothetical protein
MFTLIPLLFLAAPAGQTIGDHFYGHAGGIRDMADLTLRPARAPDCRTQEEIRKALAEQEQGRPGSCLVPRSALEPKQPR